MVPVARANSLEVRTDLAEAVRPALLRRAAAREIALEVQVVVLVNRQALHVRPRTVCRARYGYALHAAG